MSPQPDLQTYNTLYAVSMVFFAAMLGFAVAPLAEVEINSNITALRLASLEAYVLAFLAIPLLLYYVGLRVLQARYVSAIIYYFVYFALRWVILETGASAWGLKVNALYIAGLGIGPWMGLLGWISRREQHA